jgi:hypothetical protein
MVGHQLRKAAPEMRHVKMLTLLAVAMVIAAACARDGVRYPYKANFTW